ncbi:glycosyltransferase family 39 protein [Patescibacteria group bacterium]|nr:glycosyltransferase family 39 protein [Patescibacteria group bacterium]
MHKKELLVIIFITLVGGFFRFYDLANNPVSLNVDEVSVGYNAYSLLKTGRDEYGNFLPLSIRSLGDYKPPVYTYITAASIAIFGLNEWGIRFPAALFGTLTIVLFAYFFYLLSHNRTITLIGAALTAISPWLIYHSRFALETNLSVFFVVLGFLLFFKMLENKTNLLAVLSAFCFALSIYTYQTERLFTPLLITVLLILYRRQIKRGLRYQIVNFILCFILLALPFIFSFVLGSDQTRLAMVKLNNDIDFTRNIMINPLIQMDGFIAIITKLLSTQPPLLFFYWLNRTLSYLSPTFWFFNGLGLVGQNTINLGLLYIFELPFVILGIYKILAGRFSNRPLIFLWLLLGLIPSSLTIGQMNGRRILIMAPMVIYISAIGAKSLGEIILQLRKRYRYPLATLFSGIILWSMFSAINLYSVHFPRQKGEGFMDGTKEAVQYILQNQNKYQEIVFDPVRGTEGPYLTNVPYLYLLFYTQYDPALYQSQVKTHTNEGFSFSKYTFRPIDWRKDQDQHNILFIGSIWSLPPKDVPQQDILDKIYMINGQLAYLIVSPK